MRPGIIGINSSLSLVWDPSSFWGGAGRTGKGSMQGLHEKCLKQLFLCGSGAAFPTPLPWEHVPVSRESVGGEPGG